jgi:hypothetical protein
MASACASSVTGDRKSGHGRPVGTVPVDVNPMRSKAKRTGKGVLSLYAGVAVCVRLLCFGLVGLGLSAMAPP